MLIMRVQIRFCLEDGNRQAPYPRVWRHVVAATEKKCSTQVITMYAPKDGSAVYSDDAILFGEERSTSKVKNTQGKFIEVLLDGPQASDGDDPA